MPPLYMLHTQQTMNTIHSGYKDKRVHMIRFKAHTSRIFKNETQPTLEMRVGKYVESLVVTTTTPRLSCEREKKKPVNVQA